MRALLAIAVLSVAAPTVANACAMRMERPSVALADLMDEVDEPEVKKPEVVLANVEVKPADEAVPAKTDAVDAEAEAETVEPKPVVKPQS